MEWIPCSNEFEKIISRMTIPRVVIDNASCPNSTIIKVDSARKHGILLEAVQVLTDQNVCIKKAYISSDGRWFMDVFHVTDLNGNKLADKSVISYMEESLGTIHDAKLIAHEGLTALELTGTDRIGLLSEVFAVLSELQCNVVDAKLWTHNRRIASLIYVKDMDSGSHIEDSDRLSAIIARLRSVLKGDNDIRGARTSVSLGVTHTERRLHQMMFDDRDYERVVPIVSGFVEPSPVVTVYNCMEWGYSVVNINCKDRIKLMFDVVCTLTDMDYVVFHATVNAESSRVYMEFYIRHRDGTPISSDAEMQRVIQCLQASIERRTTQGVRLELCTDDKPALLAEVTRTFRENCLNVTRAEISTKGDVAVNIFYVTDGKGFLPDKKTIEEVRKKVGSNELIVKELPLMCQQEEGDEEGGGGAVGAGGAMLLSLGSLVRRNLYNLGLIRSHS